MKIQQNGEDPTKSDGVTSNSEMSAGLNGEESGTKGNQCRCKESRVTENRDLTPGESQGPINSQAVHFSSKESCFATFDQDKDGSLNLMEFGALCQALFQDAAAKPYVVEENLLKHMFEAFDLDHDGLIDPKEFESCWKLWVQKILRPVSALVVVDVQNDFINGSLAISNCEAGQNGEDVIVPINRLIDTISFDSIFYTLDWHPTNHISFFDNVKLRPIHESSPIQNPNDAKPYDTIVFDGSPPYIHQKLWPRHCVQNSWGAELHKDLRVTEGSSFIYKGTNPDLDSYSAFWDNSKQTSTTLHSQLQDKGITDVYVCGLAYDVCVAATAMDSSELGLRTILIDDASRGIIQKNILDTQKNLKEQHGVVIGCEQVESMVQGRDRCPQLGYKLALTIRKQVKIQDLQSAVQTQSTSK